MEPDEIRNGLRDDPLTRLVTIAGNVVAQRFGQYFSRQHGLTPAGAAVLAVLQWGVGRGFERGTPGRATPADLARRSFLAAPTVTGIVDTLEKGGFVHRERDPTARRVTWIVITDVGRERVAAIGAGMHGLITPTTAEQDPAKLAVIREFLLELIVNNYEKE